MKKLIVVFALSAIFFAGCSSPEKRAQRAIKTYLKENLDDPSSYQPVSFGPLDTSYVYRTYLDLKTFEKNGVENQENPLEIDGWAMTHKFRAKNKAGAIELMEETFYFDDDMNLEDI